MNKETSNFEKWFWLVTVAVGWGLSEHESFGCVGLLFVTLGCLFYLKGTPGD